MQAKPQTVLVLGATGKTGSRVTAQLRARGVDVRAASRSGEARFDWEQPAAWGELLRGVDALYISYYPDLAVPSASEQIRALTQQAVAAGVRRVVLLSGRGEQGVLPSERAVRECGARYTVLRCAWFSQNFSEGYLLGPVLEGEVAFPAGTVAEPFVDLDDVAEVAVAALTSDDHAGQTYELTGPRLLTFAEAAAEIAEAARRPVHYLPISSEQYADALVEHVPAEYVVFLTDLFREVLDGHNAYVTDGVERALGRPARDFRDFAFAAAHTGVWNQGA